MRDKENKASLSAEFIAEECIAVRLRLLTREVTKLYNNALRPHGLTISQVNILVAISCLGKAKQQEVCHALHLEKSTLSRDIIRMRVQGWINEVQGEDGRTTILRVTTAGRTLLEKAFPAWQQAQDQARILLGEREVKTFARVAKSVRSGRISGKT